MHTPQDTAQICWIWGNKHRPNVLNCSQLGSSSRHGGEGDGGGGDGGSGLGGGGVGGGGEGVGGGGEGDTHPLHWRTSWTSALTRANSARRSAIASEHPPQFVGGGSAGGVAAPTPPITQEAASNLSSRVHLVLEKMCRGLVCPGEWPETFGASLFIVRK